MQTLSNVGLTPFNQNTVKLYLKKSLQLTLELDKSIIIKEGGRYIDNSRWLCMYKTVFNMTIVYMKMAITYLKRSWDQQWRVRGTFKEVNKPSKNNEKKQILLKDNLIRQKMFKVCMTTPQKKRYIKVLSQSPHNEETK